MVTQLNIINKMIFLSKIQLIALIPIPEPAGRSYIAIDVEVEDVAGKRDVVDPFELELQDVAGAQRLSGDGALD